MSKNTNGFSAVEGLLILLIIGLLGGVGWYVWDSNQKSNESLDNAESSSNITADNIDSTYDGWETYKSSIGDFEFKYPNTWTVTKGRIDASVSQYQKEDLVLTPKETGSSSTNRFSYSLFVQNPNPSLENTPQDWSGVSASILKNGIRHAIEKKETITASEMGICPKFLLNGKNDKDYYYGYPLKNGYYLSGRGSFCPAQGDSTTLTYEDQINSTELKTALLILESIKFNN